MIHKSCLLQKANSYKPHPLQHVLWFKKLQMTVFETQLDERVLMTVSDTWTNTCLVKTFEVLRRRQTPYCFHSTSFPHVTKLRLAVHTHRTRRHLYTRRRQAVLSNASATAYIEQLVSHKAVCGSNVPIRSLFARVYALIGVQWRLKWWYDMSIGE